MLIVSYYNRTKYKTHNMTVMLKGRREYTVINVPAKVVQESYRNVRR